MNGTDHETAKPCDEVRCCECEMFRHCRQEVGSSPDDKACWDLILAGLFS